MHAYILAARKIITPYTFLSYIDMHYHKMLHLIWLFNNVGAHHRNVYYHLYHKPYKIKINHTSSGN